LADSPHNLLLQTVIAGGLPLLLCLLALIVVVGLRVLHVMPAHPEAWGLLVAVGGYALAMMANFTAAGPTCLAAFLAGALIAEAATDAEPTWSRLAGQGAFGLLAIAMLMSCIAENRVAGGIAAARGGDVTAAAARIDVARDWRPLDADIPMLGSQALAAVASAGDQMAADETRSLAEASLRRTPDSYGSLVALGVALITQRDLSAARAELDKAVALFPRRPDAYLQRAIARAGLGDIQGAVADAQATLAIDPRSQPAALLLKQLRVPRQSPGRSG
jgi:tetratricopeptide (TPR) repeat protein